MSVLFTRHRSACSRIFAGICLAALGTAASAQPPAAVAQGAESIGLTEALARTLARNPDLVALGYQVDAAEGRLRQAGLAPNPELNVALQDVLGTDAFRGAGSAETTVSLEWVLERGVRQSRVDAARTDVGLRTVEAELGRIDAAAETARRFVASLAWQSRLQSALGRVRLAADSVAAVRTRVAASRAPEAELARAEAELARAELVHEDAGHELRSSYRRLSAQWGDTSSDFESVHGDLGSLPTVEPFETLLGRVESNPELARFVSRQRLDEAQLRLAEAQSRQSWRVSGGVRRFEASDDQAFIAGITVPLPMRDRNQGRIAEARAEVARTIADRDAARIRIEATLFVLHQEFQHSLHVADKLGEDVIPRLEDALAATRGAYELGRYSYLEWRAAQAELLEARRDLLEARVEAHTLLIEIEQLTGMPVARRGQPR
jgi:outer membrane protein, heavy metal efflux system